MQQPWQAWLLLLQLSILIESASHLSFTSRLYPSSLSLQSQDMTRVFTTNPSFYWKILYVKHNIPVYCKLSTHKWTWKQNCGKTSYNKYRYTSLFNPSAFGINADNERYTWPHSSSIFFTCLMQVLIGNLNVPSFTFDQSCLHGSPLSPYSGWASSWLWCITYPKPFPLWQKA